MSESGVRKWAKQSSSPVADFRIFHVRSDRCVSPRTGEAHDFVVLDAPNWVNVIAVTPPPDEQVVLIRQYRFGVEEVTLEIPGGMIDAGEDPVAAGVRELLEETGYSAKNYTLLGYVDPNPAIQTNRCYTVLAEGAQALAAQHLDEKEDISVELWPLSRVPELLSSGKIRHALVWAAFMHHDLYRRQAERR